MSPVSLTPPLQRPTTMQGHKRHRWLSDVMGEARRAPRTEYRQV